MTEAPWGTFERTGWTSAAAPLDADGLWETWHHIAKLAELGADERGNMWNQGTYGYPAETLMPCATEIVPAGELCGTAMCFLTALEADALFAPGNTLTLIARILTRITGEDRS